MNNKGILELELNEENVSEIVQKLKYYASTKQYVTLISDGSTLEDLFYRLRFYYGVLRFYYQKNHVETSETFRKFMQCCDDPFNSEKDFSDVRNCTFTHSQLMLVPYHKEQKLEIIKYLEMKIVETYQLLGENKEPEDKKFEEYFNDRFIRTFSFAFLNNFYATKHKQFIVVEWFFTEFKTLLE